MLIVSLAQRWIQFNSNCAGEGFCATGNSSDGGDGAGCSWARRSKRFAIYPTIVLRSIWDRCLRRGVDDLTIMRVGAGLNGLVDVDHLVGTQVDRDLESVFCRRGLWAYRSDRS